MDVTKTRNISNTIDLGDVMTEDLMNKWNNIIDILEKKHIDREVSIKPTIAAKYEFDMYGLFQNELGIPPELIYPHIRVNGYNSSNCYDGYKINISILSSDILMSYYKLFTKKEKVKKVK